MAHELIYCGDDPYREWVDEIQEAFPDATIQEHWDTIHGVRLELNIPGAQEALDKFLLENGYFNICLGLQLKARTQLDYLKRLVGMKRKTTK